MAAEAAEVADHSDSEVELSESEDEEEPEQRSATGPRPDAIYNVEAMHEKLEEIGRPEGIDWIHFPAVTYKYAGAEIDANDDLAREVVFYTQALEGAREAIEKLRDLTIPIFRPEDYYAEMVKSDKHMLRVKDKLLFQKQKLEEADERKKQRESKKYSKEVQAEKVKERQKEKKSNIDSVKKWRKNREQSGYGETNDEFPVDLDDSEGPDRKKRKLADGVGGRGSRPFSRGGRGVPEGQGEGSGIMIPKPTGWTRKWTAREMVVGRGADSSEVIGRVCPEEEVHPERGKNEILDLGMVARRVRGRRTQLSPLQTWGILREGLEEGQGGLERWFQRWFQR